MKNILFCFLLFAFTASSQNARGAFFIESFTGISPNYNVVGQTLDVSGLFDIANLQAGDTLYQHDGTDMKKFVVVAHAGSNPNIDIDLTALGGATPVAGEAYLLSAGAFFSPPQNVSSSFLEQTDRYFSDWYRSNKFVHTDFTRSGEAAFGNTVHSRDTLDGFDCSIHWDVGMDDEGIEFDYPGNLLLKAGSATNSPSIELGGEEMLASLVGRDGTGITTKLQFISNGTGRLVWNDRTNGKSATLGTEADGRFIFSDQRGGKVGIEYSDVDTALVRSNATSLVSSEVAKRIAEHAAKTVDLPAENIGQAGATTGQVLRWDGTKYAPATVSGSGANAPTIIVSTQTASSVLTTFVDMPSDYTIALTSGKKYRIEVFIRYDAGATSTGLGLGLASATLGEVFTSVSFGQGGTTQGDPGFYGTGWTEATISSNATSGNVAHISSRVNCTTSGNYTLRFATEIAASAITIQGGWIEITEL